MHPQISLPTLVIRTATMSLLALAVGCSSAEEPVASVPSSVSTSSTQSSALIKATPQKVTQAPLPGRNIFVQADDRAASATTIAQSAQSKDDWNLAASLWQEAIDLLKRVPSSDPQSGKAKQKLAQYQRQLSNAQQQARGIATQKAVAVSSPSSVSKPKVVNTKIASASAVAPKVAPTKVKPKSAVATKVARTQPKSAVAKPKAKTSQTKVKPKSAVAKPKPPQTKPKTVTKPTTAPRPVSAEVALALHLTRKRAKMYGAYWCPACQWQARQFGPEAFNKIDYIECDPAGYKPQTNLCRQAKIRAFPTWEINGELYPSGAVGLDELAYMSGYQGPQNFRN